MADGAVTSGRFRGTCQDLKGAGLSTGSCCISCHEDRDLGYEMCQIDLPNGDWLHVCCWVAGELDDTDEVDILAAIERGSDDG